MISKTKLKELTAYRQQKRCDEEAVFIVEGPKMAAEAIAAGFTIRACCATEQWQGGCDHIEVSDAELERLSLMRSPNQVWMLVERPSTFSTAGRRIPLTLALDRIQDPGNLGTLMRTADWYGVRHIVCSNDTVGCYNPKVVQATMGAIFRTKVEYVDLPQWLASCGKPVYGASLKGRPLREVTPPKAESVLLIGNESRGISAAAMACVTHPVLIPNIGGTAESLNAAVAAGIIMHQFIDTER